MLLLLGPPAAALVQLGLRWVSGACLWNTGVGILSVFTSLYDAWELIRCGRIGGSEILVTPGFPTSFMAAGVALDVGTWLALSFFAWWDTRQR